MATLPKPGERLALTSSGVGCSVSYVCRLKPQTCFIFMYCTRLIIQCQVVAVTHIASSVPFLDLLLCCPTTCSQP